MYMESRSSIYKHCRKTCRKTCHEIIITRYLRCHKIILRHVVNEFAEFIFSDRNFFTKAYQSPMDSSDYAVLFWYCGTISSIAIFESLSSIHFSRRTTLRCIIFYSMSVVKLYVFTWLGHSNGLLPMQSAVYLYINNLSSKKPRKTDIV